MKKIEIINKVLDECESTNDYVKRLGEQGFPQGTWISSKIQTRGRGRQGRVWSSEEGNLFLSILIREVPPFLWTWVPLISGLGLYRALQKKYPKIEFQLKWPNDLWVQEKKIAGILCESSGSAQGKYIVVGLGLNCRMHPDLPEAPATSLSHELKEEINAEDVRESVLQEVLEVIQELQPEKLDSLRKEYLYAALFKPGIRVSWVQDGNSYEGKVLGLGPQGELRVEVNGAEQSLFAEEIRLARRI